MKNGLLLSPFRTALSGQPTSPAGGVEIAVVLGKDETLNRIQKGIKVLTVD
jgi:glutamyl-tRNA synthetase